jgi:hypothetical protein
VLLASPEHRARLGGSNQAFLEALFAAALGRPLDADAAAFFDSLLVFGIPHAVVAEYVLASPEARRIRAGELGQVLLRRPLAAEELDRFAASLANFGEASTVAAFVTEPAYDALQPTTYRATVSVAGGAPSAARVVRRLDGSFGVVAPIVVVTRSSGEQLAIDVPVTATRARNETYLDAVAVRALGRPIDPGTLADLVARIPAGGSRTRARAALTLLVGEESRARIAGRLYRELLGRDASADEARFWGERIAASNIQVVRALILGSDEVVAQGGGTAAGWLDTLYRRALGRPIDPGGLAAWQAQLATGLPRPFVAYAVLTSEEARTRIAERWSLEILGRAPTEEERFLGTFLAGIPPYEIGFPALLLGGDAFYALHTGAPS